MPTRVPTCAICGSTENRQSKALAECLGLQDPFGILKCKNCAFCWQSPRPEEAEMAAFYNYIYFGGPLPDGTKWMNDYPSPPETTRRYSSTNRSFTYEQQKFHLELIDKHKDRQETRLLEIGSGKGGFLKIVGRIGIKGVGLEPSESAVREARADGLEVYQGKLENPPDQVKFKSWDVIFMSHVFEHFECPRVAAQHLWNLLEPGGFVVLEVPNQFEAWMEKCSLFLRSLTKTSRSSTMYSVHHLSFFSIRHLEGLFSSEGFELVSTSWTPKRFNTPRNIASSIIDGLGEIFAKQGRNIQLVATRPKVEP